jgi:hypothetical protein
VDAGPSSMNTSVSNVTWTATLGVPVLLDRPMFCMAQVKNKAGQVRMQHTSPMVLGNKTLLCTHTHTLLQRAAHNCLAGHLLGVVVGAALYVSPFPCGPCEHTPHTQHTLATLSFHHQSSTCVTDGVIVVDKRPVVSKVVDGFDIDTDVSVSNLLDVAFVTWEVSSPGIPTTRTYLSLHLVDPESGLPQPLGPDEVPLIVHNTSTYALTGVAMDPGETYVVCVRAVNDAGVASDIVCSDGVLIGASVVDFRRGDAASKPVTVLVHPTSIHDEVRCSSCLAQGLQGRVWDGICGP